MNIRTATSEDLDKIMEIETASFIPEIQEERSVFASRIANCPSLFLIFYDDFKVAGYISAELMSKKPETPEELRLGHLPEKTASIKNQPYLYISSFALLPSFRGNGNGQKCWNLAMDYFKNHFETRSLLLLVNEQWQGAYHIYKKSGFSEISIFKDFFPCSERGKSNGILMENLLN